MPLITIQIPDEQMPRLQELAEAQGFKTPADYVLDLLERDLQHIEDQEIEAVLVERATSNDRVEVDEEFFRRLHEVAAARIEQVRRR